MAKVLKALAWVLAAIVVIVFFAYADFWPSPPPPGELVDVDGRDVHVLCMGPEAKGSGTAVWLESPGHGFTIYWTLVQQGLAERGIRSCSYDRSGFGWSETYAGPYDAEREVDDAIAALSEVGDAEVPLVLVGHSYGGVLVRVFAARLPGRVKGIVYVDPATITLWRRGLDSGEMSNAEFPTGLPWPAIRLLMRLSDSESYDMYRHMTARASFFSRMEDDQALFAERTKALAVYPPPDVPSIIISRAQDEAMFSAELDKLWFESYRTEIGDRLDDVRYVVAEDSDHEIPRKQPEIVVEAVVDLIGPR